MEIKELRISNHTNKCLIVLDYDLLQKAYQQDLRQQLDSNIDLIGITFENRLDELTPWKSKMVNNPSRVFLGQADSTIQTLKKIVDQYQNKEMILVGYSLSSLMLIYALLSNNIKKTVNYALISPSLWYERFMEYVQDGFEKIQFHGKVLLLYGKEEGLQKPYPLSNTTRFNDQLYELLNQKITCQRKLFDGGHHDYMIDKINQIFAWVSTD